MPRKYTEARKNGNRKWDAENLDRIGLAVPKGDKARISDHAAAMGETTSRFIRRAIEETMERDKGAGE